MTRQAEPVLLTPDASCVDEVCPSPNFGERRDGLAPDMLILHYTGMESVEGAMRWLCDSQSEVSAHYLVFDDGRIVQMVAEANRAWHAGKSYWAGEQDINSRSIGIEVANAGYLHCDEASDLPEFPDAQMAALEALCRDIVVRNAIPAGRVLGHSDVAPGRKHDPGEKFDWKRLAEAGIGLWCDAKAREGKRYGIGDRGEEVITLQRAFAAFGYGLEITGIYDDRTRAVVRAFQQHWRPARADGVADEQTISRLGALSILSKN